ncbi:MAG TPA: hypothetical protein VFV91_11150 [Gaiellaceae bacterium]|nr:hypothetical protein [Gaiellaceae bacterium]
MEEDWRLTGQELFLQSAAFRHKPYRACREGWEHDHCTFCIREFVEQGAPSDDPEAQTAGYAAIGRGPQGEDDYHWVCDECFSDFRKRFGWSVVESEG